MCPPTLMYPTPQNESTALGVVRVGAAGGTALAYFAHKLDALVLQTLNDKAIAASGDAPFCPSRPWAQFHGSHQ